MIETKEAQSMLGVSLAWPSAVVVPLMCGFEFARTAIERTRTARPVCNIGQHMPGYELALDTIGKTGHNAHVQLAKLMMLERGDVEYFDAHPQRTSRLREVTHFEREETHGATMTIVRRTGNRAFFRLSLVRDRTDVDLREFAETLELEPVAVQETFLRALFVAALYFEPGLHVQLADLIEKARRKQQRDKAVVLPFRRRA